MIQKERIYCFTSEKKGNIVDFVKDYFGQVFKGAVEMILGCRAYEMTEHYVPPSEKKPKGDLVLPPKDKDFNRTIAYLTGTRGIDKEIVYAMINAGKVYGVRTDKTAIPFITVPLSDMMKPVNPGIVLCGRRVQTAAFGKM